MDPHVWSGPVVILYIQYWKLQLNHNPSTLGNVKKWILTEIVLYAKGWAGKYLCSFEVTKRYRGKEVYLS